MFCRRSYPSSTLTSFLALVAVLTFTLGAAASTPPSFLPASTYYWDGGVPTNLTVVDLNGDGRPDLLVSGNGVTGSVAVLLNNGDGTFQEPSAYYDTGGQAASPPVVADVNGDGKPDLVIAEDCAGSSANCVFGEPIIGVLLGNGDGTFQPVVVYKTGGYSSGSSVAVGNLNGDGKPDLVAADLRCTSTGFEGCVSVLLGKGDGTFLPAQVYDAAGSDAQSVMLTDVNGDGKLDILVTNSGGNPSSIGVLLGNGDGSFQAAVPYGSGGGFAQGLLVADVNRDRRPDLLLANTYSDTIGVLLGIGDGTFRAATVYPSGGQGIESFVVADLNNDGDLDIAVANCGVVIPSCPGSGNGSVGVLLGNGDGTFAAAVAYDSGTFPNAPEALDVADLNGDSNPDLIVARFYSGLLGVLQGQGDGTFQPAVFYDSGVYKPSGIYGNHILTALDVNGDGKPDLVLLGMDSTGRGEVGVLLNNTSNDTSPPRITISITTEPLRPPDRKTVPVRISGRITDAGSGVNVNSATYVVKDEYGRVQQKGTITLSARGDYSFTIFLQASGFGRDHDGRHYTITVRAKDNAGNLGSKTKEFIVPHDHGE